MSEDRRHPAERQPYRAPTITSHGTLRGVTAGVGGMMADVAQLNTLLTV